MRTPNWLDNTTQLLYPLMSITPYRHRQATISSFILLFSLPSPCHYTSTEPRICGEAAFKRINRFYFHPWIRAVTLSHFSHMWHPLWALLTAVGARENILEWREKGRKSLYTASTDQAMAFAYADHNHNHYLLWWSTLALWGTGTF